MNGRDGRTHCRPRLTIVCSPQSRQREGQSQAQPENLRGGPEVKDKAVAGPVVRARGHNTKEEHHREETAQADRDVKQCGGSSEPDVEQSKPAQVRMEGWLMHHKNINFY